LEIPFLGATVGPFYLYPKLKCVVSTTGKYDKHMKRHGKHENILEIPG
jgi:hypothetical protein